MQSFEKRSAGCNRANLHLMATAYWIRIDWRMCWSACITQETYLKNKASFSLTSVPKWRLLAGGCTAFRTAGSVIEKTVWFASENHGIGCSIIGELFGTDVLVYSKVWGPVCHGHWWICFFFYFSAQRAVKLSCFSPPIWQNSLIGWTKGSNYQIPLSFFYLSIFLFRKGKLY